MCKAIAVRILILGNGLCQNCLTYGTRLGLEGNLPLRDVSGYNRFILLTLQSDLHC